MLLGHRYYDAGTGRFISQDPIHDGTNWYAYCENNPLVRTDPRGELWWVLIIVAVVVVIGCSGCNQNSHPHPPSPGGPPAPTPPPPAPSPSPPTSGGPPPSDDAIGDVPGDGNFGRIGNPDLPRGKTWKDIFKIK